MSRNLTDEQIIEALAQKYGITLIEGQINASQLGSYQKYCCKSDLILAYQVPCQSIWKEKPAEVKYRNGYLGGRFEDDLCTEFLTSAAVFDTKLNAVVGAIARISGLSYGGTILTFLQIETK